MINLRTIKGRRQFLVRWKGYGESADTWENEKDLSCPKLIQEYLAKEREKDIKSSKTGSAKADKSKKSKGNSKKQTENGILFLFLIVLSYNILFLKLFIVKILCKLL